MRNTRPWYGDMMPRSDEFDLSFNTAVVSRRGLHTCIHRTEEETDVTASATRASCITASATDATPTKHFCNVDQSDITALSFSCCRRRQNAK